MRSHRADSRSNNGRDNFFISLFIKSINSPFNIKKMEEKKNANANQDYVWFLLLLLLFATQFHLHCCDGRWGRRPPHSNIHTHIEHWTKLQEQVRKEKKICSHYARAYVKESERWMCCCGIEQIVRTRHMHNITWSGHNRCNEQRHREEKKRFGWTLFLLLLLFRTIRVQDMAVVCFISFRALNILQSLRRRRTTLRMSLRDRLLAFVQI